ncbi:MULTISPECIES: biopolymer transporter ExbD [unclassified Nitratiruptor]|uniref:ExbD/TolR family protein n=1 Tax=unclassified Nitratiruptor TaxID=2624044 RepID=UPI00193577CE|nr:MULTISPECIES: biopolymer transporter ExbD [unclassified Nitratiruptor]BCD60730.1 biopolymer transport protein ExbD [Nitratiruptor sp. YY08-10]BCD64662.1 biopolymer transport protein ExbD [Nitratiruptor sp. YY08-14]
MRIKRFDQINVIPFIDIMLVLLVIVLTTATFIAKGVIPIDLPKAGSAKELPVKKIDISITKDGTIYLEKEKVDTRLLVQKLKTYNTKSSILIRSDKNAKFETFIEVLDLLKSNGYNNIAVETVK